MGDFYTKSQRENYNHYQKLYKSSKEKRGLEIICCSCGYRFWYRRRRIKKIIVTEVARWFLKAECPRCGIPLRDSNKIPNNDEL